MYRLGTISNIKLLGGGLNRYRFGTISNTKLLGGLNRLKVIEVRGSRIKRYKEETIRKRCNQKEIPTPKTEVGKTKLTIRYLYLENTSQAE